MKRKTVLITGSTDGVGRCVAEKFARLGATVLIHGRDNARAQSLARAINSEGGQASIYRADFSALSEVRTLSQELLREHNHIDVLINNAGIGVGGRGGRRELSQDGFELRFAVNYLSGFLLTRQLLPILINGEARIVHVSSVGQEPIDFQDVMLANNYSGGRAYCQSKLAQIMFTFDLAEELKNSSVTANALHPATYMDTAMVRRDGVAPMSSVEEGADAIFHLASATDMADRSGLYFDGLRPSRARPQAYDLDARTKLRKLSLELTGLS